MLNDILRRHANGDKNAFLVPLAERLKVAHPEDWCDESTLPDGRI